MKKWTILGIVATMLVAFWGNSPACHLSFETDKDQVIEGESVDVKVTIGYEHRRCVIELEDTQFKLTNFEIVNESDWQQEKRSVFSKVLTLKPINPGTGKLEIIRECSKKGISSKEWEIRILESNMVSNAEKK